MTHLVDPLTYSIMIAYLGAFIFLTGEIFALRNWRNVPRLLIFSAIAELGFATIGFAGGEVGILGGGMHIVYQVVMRVLIVLALIKMARQAGGYALDRLTGIGRVAPIAAILFAFGMFSLLGLSPFKGAHSRFIIFYDMIEHGQWILAFIATAGSMVAAVYVIRVIQALCFAAPKEPATTEPTRIDLSPFNLALLGAALVTAYLNFYADLVAEVAAFIFGAGGHLPHFEGPWPLLAVVPYLGAFGVWALGYISAKVRDASAVVLAAGTFGLALTTTSLDPVSYLFAVLFSAVILFVTLYSTAYMRHEGGSKHYYFFLFLMTGSLMGVATAQDLASFYIFWELMTWTSYLLIVHTRSPEALKAGAKYFIMCAGGAYVMHLGIVGVGVQANGFEFAGLAQRLEGIDPLLATGLVVAFLVGCGVKAGFVPLHGWLPVAHPAAPSSISAPLSSILTKTGMLGILKVLLVGFGVGSWGIFAGGWNFGLTISAIGVISLLYGEVMAWKQQDIKRMLAYSTIAQVGEITAVIGLATSLAIAGASAHILAHGVMKTLLFLGAGAFIMRVGSRQLADMSGIGRRMPLTALFFVVGVLAIMGLPPFVGFTSKFLMVYASVEAGAIPIAVALLLGGVIGVLYYGRLIRVVMFDPISEKARSASEAPVPMILALGGLAAVVLGLGLMPAEMLRLAGAVANSVALSVGQAEIVLPNLLVQWPLAALICAGGGVVTLIVGRAGRAIAGSIAAGTMALAFAAIWFQSDQYDALSWWFTSVILLLGLLNFVYSVGYFSHHGHKTERFMGMMVLMIGGLVGMAGAKDLFSFFFFWEIMSSWALYFAIIHEETEDALREGFKYFFFNMIGAAFLFLGVVVLAVSAESFAFADVSAAASTMPDLYLIVGAGCALIGFAMKAAMFTMRVDYQMHPATAPTPVSGYISAVLLKSGPLGAFKLITLLGGATVLSRLGAISGLDPLSYGLAIVGAVTALYAGLMAFIQVGIKRLLIYSTVAQLGYVMCGLALGDALSTAGGLAHAFNHALLKNTLFLAAGAILAQQHLNNLDEISGAGRRMPWTFAFFAIAGLSLAGVPPLSGLGSKWLLYQGTLVSGHPYLVLLLMAASLTTLAAVLKFVHAGFLGHPTEAAEKLHEAPATMLIPMGLLTALTLVIGFLPGLILVPIAHIQSTLGIAAIEASWFGPLPGPYGWHPVNLGVPLLTLCAIGWGMMRLGQKPVTRSQIHTCGVENNPERMRVPATDLYASPKRLVRQVLFIREAKP